jgi:streptogramin lyase
MFFSGLLLPKRQFVVPLLALFLLGGCTPSVSSQHSSKTPVPSVSSQHSSKTPVPSVSITEFPLQAAYCQGMTPCGPGGITAGPDGNLWFVESNSNRIGRITPGGAITTFPLPTPNSLPSGITTGPDGNLWFTEDVSDQIGRITPSGALTEFPPLPTPNSGPVEITAGPDGNLWFTENGSDKIGRITPGGTLTEFPLPTSDDVPWGIATGPDGNLWFTESGSDTQVPRHIIRPSQIGRITPGGSITEFPLPRNGSDPVYDGLAMPQGITAGPDGNLWFAEWNGNRIGRITPGGAITTFPLPTPDSEPSGITTGRDGNLWFTERHGVTIISMLLANPFPVWNLTC